MVYRKIIVDNPVCMRRFHLACDDDEEYADSAPVKLRCPHCQVVIFTSTAGEKVSFLREENLTKVTSFSTQLLNECAWRDNFHRVPRDG